MKLKDQAISIKEFGLGFIQVKLKDSNCINFYTNKVKKFSNLESPHNHQRDFKSEILSGQLIETVFQVSQVEDGLGAFCGCGNTDEVIHERYNHIVSEINVYVAGDVYFRKKEEFHTVVAENNTITKFTKLNVDNTHNAIVIGPKHDYKPNDYSEDDLWKIVGEIMDELDISLFL